jgi:hypothetical protein
MTAGGRSKSTTSHADDRSAIPKAACRLCRAFGKTCHSAIDPETVMAKNAYHAILMKWMKA